MNDDAVKAAVGRFMKYVNVAVQREMEKAVRNAMAKGKLRPSDSCNAAVTLSSDRLELDVTIYSRIEL
jgi:hypothetical protein